MLGAANSTSVNTATPLRIAARRLTELDALPGDGDRKGTLARRRSCHRCDQDDVIGEQWIHHCSPISGSGG